MDKISVIIPVYNVEKYLRQCLDSVINQTYKNIEIICIDDCSTDNSFQILKEYEKKDDRIRVYKNEQNIKAGLTRNRGLEIATGEYIHFLDSDDWLELDAYEKLIYTLNKYQSTLIEAIQFEMKNVNSKGKIVRKIKLNDKYTNTIVNLSENNKIISKWNGYSCNKLYYKNTIIDNCIKFNDNICFEDSIFNISILIKAKSIIFLKDLLYNYRKDNISSLTYNSEKYLDCACKQFLDTFAICQDLPIKLKESLLKWRFYDFFHIIYGLYKKKKITYNDFRYYINSVNKDDYIFSQNTGCFTYSKEVLNSPEIIFKTKMFMRYLLSKLKRVNT